MTKDEIEQVRTLMDQGQSLTQIATELYNINRNALRYRLMLAGYRPVSEKRWKLERIGGDEK